MALRNRLQLDVEGLYPPLPVYRKQDLHLGHIAFTHLLLYTDNKYRITI